MNPRRPRKVFFRIFKNRRTGNFTLRVNVTVRKVSRNFTIKTMNSHVGHGVTPLRVGNSTNPSLLNGICHNVIRRRPHGLVFNVRRRGPNFMIINGNHYHFSNLFKRRGVGIGMVHLTIRRNVPRTTSRRVNLLQRRQCTGEPNIQQGNKLLNDRYGK